MLVSKREIKTSEVGIKCSFPCLSLMLIEWLYAAVLHNNTILFIPTVDKMTHMVGSYAPKEEIQSYTTPMEDAPSGLIARGHYTVKSLFTDDDGNEHLKWEWSFDIKKDWN